MKTKKVTFGFLENANAIQITTLEQKVDLVANQLKVEAFFGGEKVPSYRSTSGQIINEANQRIRTAFDIPILGNRVNVEVTGEESIIDQVQVIPHFIDPVSENDYWLLSAMIGRFKDSVGFISQFWSATFQNRAEVMRAVRKASPDHYDVLEKWMTSFVEFRHVERDQRSQTMHKENWQKKLQTIKDKLDLASIELKEFCVKDQIQIGDVLRIAA